MTTVHGAHSKLAFEGGTPVRTTMLRYGSQRIEEEDIQAVVDVLRSEWITTGPKVDEFEQALASYVGARHGVAFSSGTAALHGAVFAAGIGPGDEAITSPMTFCATANCVIYQGGTPVFADVSPDTLNLDPEQVERRLSPRTKAVLPVDYAGHPADLDAFTQVAGRRGLTIIEDACHALGAVHRGRPIGSISHMTVFSFHPVKHITTGEGGMVTTNDDSLAAKLRLFRAHGVDTDFRARSAGTQWAYDMVALGYNYRLPDIACALGLSQLRRIEGNLARRRHIAQTYSSAFGKLSAVATPTIRPEALPAWHLYPIRLDLPQLRAGRAEIFKALRAEGIGVNVHYVPVHLFKYYRQRYGYKGGEFPIAEAAYERLISLPMHHGMTDQDVQDVIEAVSKVVQFYAA